MRRVRGEYNRVTLQAGYEAGYGVIFQGNIKQFRIGKENATDKFLDIFAGDGDIGYNHGFINKTFAAGTTSKDIIEAAAKAMGLVLAHMPTNHFTFPRGKVLFGLARAQLSTVAATMGATRSIQNGRVQMIPLDGYLPGEAVRDQFGYRHDRDSGAARLRHLRPHLAQPPAAHRRAHQVEQQRHQPHVQRAPLSGDGLYRVLVVEHVGDTRGQEWYSDVIALAVNQAAKRVVEGA